MIPWATIGKWAAIIIPGVITGIISMREAYDDEQNAAKLEDVERRLAALENKDGEET